MQYSSVKRWIDGICAPDINLFPAICRYMNVSINELLNIGVHEGLNTSQEELLNRYQNDKSFKRLCNSYKDDEEVKVTLIHLVKIKK